MIKIRRVEELRGDFFFHATGVETQGDKVIIKIQKRELLEGEDLFGSAISEIKIQKNHVDKVIKVKEGKYKIRIKKGSFYHTGYKRGQGIGIEVENFLSTENTNTENSTENTNTENSTENTNTENSTENTNTENSTENTNTENSTENTASSEKEKKVREMVFNANSLLEGNDWKKMEEAIKQLENIKNNGSEEEKKEFKSWMGESTIQELKTRVGETKPQQNSQNGNDSQKVNQQAKEEVAQEEKNAKNDLNESINQAKNGTKEQKYNSIKLSGKTFGTKKFQEQEEEIIILQNQLFHEDPEKYRQAMIGKVESNLEINNLTENEALVEQELKEQ
jgi:hypothetical protein